MIALSIHRPQAKLASSAKLQAGFQKKEEENVLLQKKVVVLEGALATMQAHAGQLAQGLVVLELSVTEMKSNQRASEDAMVLSHSESQRKDEEIVRCNELSISLETAREQLQARLSEALDKASACPS